MTNNKPVVSYFIPAYKDTKSLENCLNSIREQDYPNKEIIVTNDGNNKEVEQMIKDHFPEVKLINLPRNHGHAGASNIGLANTKGEYIAILDDDSVIGENWTSKLVNKFKKTNENIGVIEPKLIDRKDKKTTNIRYNEEKYLSKFTSAGVLAKKSVLESVNYYDENFFIYKDDYDLAARILKKDYKILSFPSVTTYHTHDPNAKPSPFAFFYSTRNSYWFCWKHYDQYNAIMFTFYHFTKRGLRSIKYGYKKEFLKASIGSLRGLKKYLISENEKCEELEYRSWNIKNIITSIARFFKGNSELREIIKT